MRLPWKGIFVVRGAQDAVRNIFQEFKSTAYYAAPVFDWSLQTSHSFI
jgi:hypothetical protein